METECRDMCGSEDLLKSFPLHRACRDGDLSTLSGLLGAAVVSVCDAATQDPLFGWTPAHWAAHNGKVECLEMLIKAGVPCDITTLGPGLTLAHVAALEGQTSCLTWLCKNGVSINAQDDMGETAAHKAVRCGSVECLHILQHHGADFSLHSSIGMTVLDVALQNQQTGCIEYFQAGGDVTNHMTCMNGRRKRMQASEEVEMDTAKRARLESAAQLQHHLAMPQMQQDLAAPQMQQDLDTPQMQQDLDTPQMQQDLAPPQMQQDSATPNNQKGHSHDVAKFNNQLKHDVAMPMPKGKSASYEITENEALLPSVAVVPNKIPREDHWKYQPFCI